MLGCQSSEIVSTDFDEKCCFLNLIQPAADNHSSLNPLFSFSLSSDLTSVSPGRQKNLTLTSCSTLILPTEAAAVSQSRSCLSTVGPEDLTCYSHRRGAVRLPASKSCLRSADIYVLPQPLPANLDEK